MPPIHLQPTAELAPRVLLPGDPGRAMRLAQALIESPRMFNHHRGLWGYSGAAKHDGKPLTIQSTGLGAPSAAIVIHELIELGALRLIRLGTCRSLVPGVALGALVAVRASLPRDGVSRACGAGPERPAQPDPALTESLCERGAVPVLAVSTDLFYGVEGFAAEWVDAGAEVVDLESAALFTLAARAGVVAAAASLVTCELTGPQRRLSPEALATGEQALVELVG